MNPIRLIAILSLFIATFTGCQCETVRAGNVGVHVYTMGSEKGEFSVVGIGRHFIGFNEELYLYPTFKQTEVWAKPVTVEGEKAEKDESISFQTKEGMSVSADVGLTYSVNPEKVIDLFKAYRKPIGDVTDTFIRNHVRDALGEVAGTMPVESVYGSGKTEMMNRVQEAVAAKVAPIGIIIDEVYLINELRLPKTVVEALNEKIAATQKAQQRENELREAEAQAKKIVAAADGEAKSILIRAEAQSKANDLLSRSLTDNLVKQSMIDKWDGHMPIVGGGAGTIIDMGELSKARAQ